MRWQREQKKTLPAMTTRQHAHALSAGSWGGSWRGSPEAEAGVNAESAVVDEDAAEEDPAPPPLPPAFLPTHAEACLGFSAGDGSGLFPPANTMPAKWEASADAGGSAAGF